MEGEFGSVRQVISGPIPGRPLARWRLKLPDHFKKHAPPVLLAGKTVVLFAKAMPSEPTPEQSRKIMRSEEDRLNRVWISLGSRAPGNLLPVAVGEVSPEPREAFALMEGA